jgi:hypothetical protein
VNRRTGEPVSESLLFGVELKGFVHQFTGSPVHPFAGSPVRRFAGSPVSLFRHRRLEDPNPSQQ